MSLQYPGGKKRLAPWIVSMIPPHHSYLEPYFGAGSVLFAKVPARIETVNDLDGEVVNFFRVIQDPMTRKWLIERIDYTPYARDVYIGACNEDAGGQVDRAVNFAIKSMQSHGFRLNEVSGWKKDVHGREAAYALRYFNDLPADIARMAARLKNVQIENKPAIGLIRAFNHSNVFMYLDPTYVFATRSSKRKQYRHEMPDDEHEEMLRTACESKAMIMISGYRSDMYDNYLDGWVRREVSAVTQSGGRRTENVWMNYGPGAL